MNKGIACTHTNARMKCNQIWNSTHLKSLVEKRFVNEFKLEQFLLLVLQKSTRKQQGCAELQRMLQFDRQFDRRTGTEADVVNSTSLHSLLPVSLLLFLVLLRQWQLSRKCRLGHPAPALLEFDSMRDCCPQHKPWLWRTQGDSSSDVLPAVENAPRRTDQTWTDLLTPCSTRLDSAFLLEFDAARWRTWLACSLCLKERIICRLLRLCNHISLTSGDLCHCYHRIGAVVEACYAFVVSMKSAELQTLSIAWNSREICDFALQFMQIRIRVTNLLDVFWRRRRFWSRCRRRDVRCGEDAEDQPNEDVSQAGSSSNLDDDADFTVSLLLDGKLFVLESAGREKCTLCKNSYTTANQGSMKSEKTFVKC